MGDRFSRCRGRGSGRGSIIRTLPFNYEDEQSDSRVLDVEEMKGHPA